MRGTIKFWNEEKGYGFIRRDGDTDVFCHISAVYSTDNELQTVTPSIGDEVEFDIETGRKSGKPQAAKVYIRGRT